jgi:hypothetical protein
MSPEEAYNAAHANEDALNDVIDNQQEQIADLKRQLGIYKQCFEIAVMRTESEQIERISKPEVLRQQREISNLKAKIEVLMADIETKDGVIADLQEEKDRA